MKDVLDLDRYPIDDPESAAYVRLKDQCLDELARQGAAVLEGFVREDALSPMIAEVEPNLPHAYFKPKQHSPYLVADDPAFPPDHPRNRKQSTSSATLGYDWVPGDAALNRLYLWAPFQKFLADVLDYDVLYPYAYPLTPLNILFYEKGAKLGWHFDLPPFVITLTLQQSEKGGEFLFAPFLRSDDDENYDGVAEVLEDRSDAVRELLQPPGALVIFRGNRTIHKVTEIEGDSPRLAAVFSYSKTPGTISDEHNRMTFYGRVA